MDDTDNIVRDLNEVINLLNAKNSTVKELLGVARILTTINLSILETICIAAYKYEKLNDVQ